ncbi:retrovirus-related Pol polyprotein from transposon 412 isoform X1 [Toxorhynchites rutilus septentrionalis]|uniref:retrovirus-related Pol polyprotein from transposon 412 isoform X1 n=1 Tax=Toxorhynchites rutilus septentrionalis TaxID=329112 RepID=UPI00247A6DBC|nr:retrovirus-related Pol polyprotein from transposon 412 isoform X1 [Toxorhynchites rutilus septentrionalis]
MKNPSSKLTRMRLDLEEFNFDIEHVKGKQNVGPDALSRVEINLEDLKTMSILPVQTRSITKDKPQAQVNEQIDNKTDHLRAYDSINNIDAFDIPKVTFELNNTEINIYIKNKNLKRILARAQLFYYKGMINFIECIQLINDMAKTMNLKKIAISVKDPIFNILPGNGTLNEANNTTLNGIETFKKICNDNLSDVTIILYVPAKVLKDENEIQRLIKENHDTLLGGHVGINKLLQKLRRNYFWKNMKDTITTYVKNCVRCKLNKHTIKTKEVFEKTSTPIKAFDLVSMDTVGPLTRSNRGNRYALTIQCDLTKYIITLPIIDKQAKTLAKAVVENLILKHGCPKAIKTDMGTEYKNEVFKEICTMLSIDQKFSTAYHPETIGALERSHRCLNEYLRQFINEQQDDWDSWLPFFTFFYNTTPHTEHTFSPFELVFGNQANYPTELKNTTIVDPVYNHDSYHKELKFKLQLAAQKAKFLLDKSKLQRITKQSEQANRINIQLGDKVWLKRENRRKLDSVYTGPFEIVKLSILT